MNVMNSRKTLAIAALVVLILCAIVGVAILHRHVARATARQLGREPRLAMEGTQPRPVKASTPVAPKPSVPEESPRPSPAAPVPPPLELTTPTNPPPVRETARSGRALKYNGYEVEDPGARLALYFVGADPEATAYWMAAINDPSLPAEERKDLIEDLNQDGLLDPGHPGVADLPLIVNRVELIQEIAPYSLDQVNSDAFQEAYNDLVGLLNGRTPR